MATVPLSAQTLANASEDALDYGVVVNGTAGQTTVNRAGNTLRTLAYFQEQMQAALAAMGYLPAVPYTAGILINNARQTVTYEGVTYAPIVSALPFTTSGTFETAKFQVVQGLTTGQLGVGTGATLVGIQQSGGDARKLSDKLLELVSLQDYFVTGEADYNNAWAKASAAARRVFIPPGVYDLSNASFASNTEYFGVGDASILRAKAGFELFSYDSGSASAANNLINVKLRDVQLRGRCDTDGFNEQRHLIRASGVTNFVVERVYFNGFQGDGLYLGSGVGTERHNYNCKSIKCRYNGINKANRNGISIIDCTGFLSEDDYFENITQPNMPGAIDIEPNFNAYHVVKDIYVVRARAYNIGGNVAVYGLVSNETLTAQPYNIQFLDCQADTFTAAMFFVRTNIAPTATSAETKVVIANPIGRNGRLPYYFHSGKNITQYNAKYSDFTNPASVGQSAAVSRVRNVTDIGSTYTRIGSAQGIGVYIFNADWFTMKGATLDDCGTGIAGSSNAIDFGSGTSSYITLDDIEVVSPTGKTLIAVQKEVAHTFDRATNRMRNVRFNGLTNNFQAYESNEVVSVYPDAKPIIVGGGTAAGTVTYTTQRGMFQLDGKNVAGRAVLAWSAAAGASGPLQISAPMPATGNTLRDMTECVVDSYTGITVTGTLVVRFLTGLSFGGNAGGFRVYDRAANGAETLVNIGTGAAAISFKFHYVTA